MSTHYKDYYGNHLPFGQFPQFGVLSSVKVLMTGTNIAGPYAVSYTHLTLPTICSV